MTDTPPVPESKVSMLIIVLSLPLMCLAFPLGFIWASLRTGFAAGAAHLDSSEDRAKLRHVRSQIGWVRSQLDEVEKHGNWSGQPIGAPEAAKQP